MQAAAAHHLSSVRTRRWDEKIVETVYQGRITAQMAEQVREQIEPELRAQPGMEWLVNAVEATGFEVASPAATRRILVLFHRYRGHRIAAVLPSPTIRMVVSALVFAMRLPLRIFDTRRDALAYLRSPST